MVSAPIAPPAFAPEPPCQHTRDVSKVTTAPAKKSIDHTTYLIIVAILQESFREVA